VTLARAPARGDSAPRIDDPEYFVRLADVEARHWWALGLWRLTSYWLDADLRGRRGLRALDIGCGAGMTACRLSNRSEISEVIGLDPAPRALALAGARFPGRLVRGSMLELPFDDGAFDLVTCFDVIQHIASGERPRALAELRRVLPANGLAAVRSNGRGWAGDRSTFRLGQLAGLLRDAGFQVRRSSYANALPALFQELSGALDVFRRDPRVEARRRGHPAGGGLRIAVPAAPWNELMKGVTSLEAWLAGRVGVRLPFGHSTLVLIERAA
jgi:SAM-dependent methyltransferase